MKASKYSYPIFLIVLGSNAACQHPNEHSITSDKGQQIEWKRRMFIDSVIDKELEKSTPVHLSLTDSIADKCIMSISLRNKDLRQLDSVSCTASKQQAERIAMTTSELWRHQFHPLITYLAMHPHSCLQQKVALGLTEDIVMRARGAENLDSLKNGANRKAKSTRLTVQEQKLLKEILADVHPEIFD